MKNTTFYIDNFFYTKQTDNIDVSFIPPIIRRKLSPLDKVFLLSINNIPTDNIEELVFSSAFGEITRLDNIIQQYKEFNEVSPAQFSGSVHNYPAGFYTLYKKINIPYYAIASGKNSISAGLIKAIFSSKKNVLFSYADKVSVSCMIKKDKGKIHCRFNPESTHCENEFENFVDFLEGKNNVFQTDMGYFERIYK